MERRFLLAAVLSALVLMVWQVIMPPPPPPDPAAQTSAVTAGEGDKAVTSAPAGASASAPAGETTTASQPAVAASGAAPVPGAFVSPDASLEKQTKVVKSPLYEATFTSEGGGLKSFKLLEYKAYKPEVGFFDHFVGLFRGGETAPTPDQPADLLNAPFENNLFFAMEGLVDANGRYDLTEATDTRVVFVRNQGNLKITRTFSLKPDDYMIQQEITLENLSSAPITATPVLGMNGHFLDPDKEGKSGYAPHINATYFVGTEHKLFPHGKLEAPHKVSGPLGWAGVDDRYFLRAILPEQVNPGTVTITPLATLDFRAELDHGPITLLPGQPRALKSSVFLGPKRSEVLKAHERDLIRSLDYGMLSLFAEPLLWLLKQLHSFIGSWGLAIMLLTLIVKTLLYPLFVKQIESGQKMKEFQPQMKAIQEQFGDDKNRQNQEMMRFMQENKINPLGGCFPVLLQMPIWFAVYQVIQNAIELYRESFLYLPDLSARDPYGISPLILGVLMFVQQKMTPMQPGMDPMQVKMLQFMPIIFAGMMFTLPSGLVVYILVNTLLGIAQQWYVTRRMERAAAAKKAAPAR